MSIVKNFRGIETALTTFTKKIRRLYFGGLQLKATKYWTIANSLIDDSKDEIIWQNNLNEA